MPSSSYDVEVVGEASAESTGQRPRETGRRLEIDPDDTGAVRQRHLQCRSAEAAADIEDTPVAGLDAAQYPGNVARPSGRHVALAPDELEHGDHVVVVLVVVRAHA